MLHYYKQQCMNLQFPNLIVVVILHTIYYSICYYVVAQLVGFTSSV